MNRIIIVIFLLFSTIAYGQNVDSIKQLIKVAKHDSIRAKLYIEVTESVEMEQVDTIERYCKLAISIDEKQLTNSLSKVERLFYLKNLSVSFNNLGYVYYARDDRKKAFEFYNRAITIQEYIKDSSNLGSSYSNIARLFEACFDTLHAMEAYKKGLVFAKDYKDNTVYTEILYSMATLNLANKNYIEAEKNYSDLASNSILPEQNESKFTALTNLGSIYAIKGDTLKAIESFKKSLDLSTQANHKISIAEASNALGAIYRNQNNFTEAEYYFKLAFKTLESLKDENSLAVILRNYSKLYIRKRDLKEAEKLALKSMEYAKNTGSYSEIKYSAEILCQIYNLQKSNQAGEYGSLTKAMGDSVNKISQENKLFLDDFRKAYDAFDADFIKKYDEVKSQPSEKSNLTLYIIGISLLIVFGGFYFYNKRK